MIPAILHMGLPKTGSSSVQAFFNRNRDLLQTKGILYPKSLGLKAHVKLLALAGHSEYKKFDPKYSSERKEEIRKTTIEEIRLELQRNPVQRVILSCENMPSASPSIYRQLRLSLGACGLRVDKVILYLRPQAEWRRSVIQQRIKVGILDDEMLYPVDDPKSCGKYGCYQDHVERRAKAFGMKTMKLRLFGPEYFKDGDFHSEIREAFELPEAPYKEAAPSNESLGDFACQMLLHLNKTLPRYKSNGRECPRRLHIRKVAAKFLTASGNGAIGKAPLPSEITKKYEEYYWESNEWIRQRFFPERSRLFETKSPPIVADAPVLNLESRAKEAADRILSLRRNSDLKDYFLELQKNILSIAKTPLTKISPMIKTPKKTKATSAYQSQAYWRKRSGMIYYRYIEKIVGSLGAKAASLLDVGSGNCPYLDWFDWIPERVSVDIRVPYQSAQVRGIQGDIFKLEFSKPFDLCTCLQVLEHVPDAEKFARRLLELGRVVVVSVPYKWPNAPKPTPGHIHDPVDYAKLTRWMGRKADYKIIVEEPLSKSPRRRRLIAVYNSDPT